MGNLSQVNLSDGAYSVSITCPKGFTHRSITAVLKSSLSRITRMVIDLRATPAYEIKLYFCILLYNMSCNNSLRSDFRFGRVKDKEMDIQFQKFKNQKFPIGIKPGIPITHKSLSAGSKGRLCGSGLTLS